MLDVEWKKYSEESIVLIIGKVRHRYAANKTPLRPWVLVRCNGTVLVAHCTCMAGLAETCSHVGAILHWVETAVRVHDDYPMHIKREQMAYANTYTKYPILTAQGDRFQCS